MSEVFLIYRATSPSGKCYIGQTKKTLAARFSRHVREAKAGRLPFHRALLKYGLEAFNIEVVGMAECRADADAIEVDWIATLRTQDPTIGYNLASGGQGGGGYKRQPLPPESIERMRLAKLGVPSPKKGRPVSAEVRAKNKLAAQARARPFQCDQTGQVFNNLSDAALSLGIHKASIAQVVSGKRNSIFGLTFSILNKECVS